MCLRWDIFCHVIDNFGDVGVSWRLACQLQRDYKQRVRLWVDDLNSLAYIVPSIKSGLARQFSEGVEVCQWQSLFLVKEPADVVIEMFACELPDLYVTAMSQLKRPPVWINLDYLSAESWVSGYHGLPSFHPRLPLTKTFFFPGFAPGTGGLLREKHLMRLRDMFDDEAQQQFWQSIHLPVRQENELRISLFCYKHAPLAELLDIFTQSPIPVFLIIPQGNVADRVLYLKTSQSNGITGAIKSGQLTVYFIPFLEQSGYDRLLWACDLNFVRGEDSFVRAQWAGKPLVWHAYPQPENVHWKKLAAFLDLYTQPMIEKKAVDRACAVRQFWSGWNACGRMIDRAAWSHYIHDLEALKKHSIDWMQQLMTQDDLTFNLVQFAKSRL